MGPKPVFDRDPICRLKSQVDFPVKIGIRLRNENRLLIFPERFSIAIVIAIAFSKSGPDRKPREFFPAIRSGDWFDRVLFENPGQDHDHPSSNVGPRACGAGPGLVVAGRTPGSVPNSSSIAGNGGTDEWQVTDPGPERGGRRQRWY
jgi:hypothetical protein